MRVWTVGLAIGLAAGGMARGAVERPRVEAEHLYRAQRLVVSPTTNELSLVRLGRPWDLSSREGCNITFFSPDIRDLDFGPDGLRFTPAGASVIGWGNVENLQPPAERIKMFPGFNDIELTVSQSATGSVWRIQLWMDGSSTFTRNASRHEFSGAPWASVSKGTFEAAVAGTNRQTIRFRAFRGQPDGFSLRIAGPENNRIAIHDLRITQTVRGEGRFRRVVMLPAGRSIWRAVGEAGGVRLLVNGREVNFMPSLLKSEGDMQTYPVNLAPYLDPSAPNVLALDPAGSSLAYLQGRIVLDDGSALTLDTGPDWRCANEPPPGWEQPGVDDSSWQTPQCARPDYHHLVRRWPVYDGRLLLENPGRERALYYDDSEPIRVAARIPGAWPAPRPDLRWTLRRVERDTHRPAVARGTAPASSAAARDGSLVYGIEAGRQVQGVYTLEAELAADGRVVERRLEEPLIVVGRLAMPEVAGDRYEDGLELELEDVIDFTDPDDPHPWTEAAAPENMKKGPAGRRVTESRVVSTNGLTYREVTDPARGALFAYAFEFKKPHSWYLLALEYPNDADRWIGAGIVRARRESLEKREAIAPWRGSGDAQSAPIVVTGFKYPLDNAMHELRWPCWANPELYSIEIVNIRDHQPAAAARLRLYRVKELPAVSIRRGGRFFGLHTERALMIGKSFCDTDGLDEYQNHYEALGYDMVAQFAQRLRWQAEAARTYTAYLRFAGLNLDVMGAFQYNEMNMAYVPPERVPGDGRLLQDIRETALRYFERNGIAMYSLVEYLEHRALRAHFKVSDEDVGHGADTICYVSRDGKQGGWCGNPNHPDIEKAILRVAEDLAVKFARSPAWKGIFYNVTGEGSFGPGPNSPARDPYEYDYSDATIARFEQETGRRIPGEPADPRRFARRHQYLTSEAVLGLWTDWRCRAMGGTLVKTRDVLRTHRPDLNVLCGWHITPNPIRHWLTSVGGPYGDYARQIGMDPAVVRNEPGIWFGRTLYPVGSSHAGVKSDVWAHAVEPSVIAHYAMPNRLVVLNTCWFEYRTRLNDPAWPFANKRGTLGLVGSAHGDYALETYTQAMIGGDPDILLYGFIDSCMPLGHEQQRRQVAQALIPLPNEPFEPVLGTADFKQNLALRALRKNGDYWFYAANPGYWPLRGAVTLSGRAAVERAHDGRPVPTREADGHTVVPIDLGPYGLASFRAAGAGPDIAITAWTNEPLADADMVPMRRIVGEVTGLLETRETAMALALPDREAMRAVCRSVEAWLAEGRYAAAWLALTHWRFWELWKSVLIPAQKEAARLPDRPAADADQEASCQPVLRVTRVAGAPPAIDGRLNDPAWAKARPSFNFRSIGMSASVQLGYPLMDMAVQALYDDQALYLGLRMADPDVSALKKTATLENPIEVIRNYDDTVIVFLNAQGEQVRQFAVNAGGVTYYAGSGSWSIGEEDLRPVTWQAAAGAKPGEWVVEAAIPYAALSVDRPSAGVAWRANFFRRFREFGTMPETTWAQITEWHKANQYGALTFQ